MGVREESNPGIIIRGYSGMIRPAQLEGGKCSECSEPVFIDSRDENVKTITSRVQYVHWGCSRE